MQGLTEYSNPAFPGSSCQLYTLPDQDDDSLTSVMSPSEVSMQYVDYDEPPMDSLPDPPPADSTSPLYFQPPLPRGMQDGVIIGSLSFVHNAPFQMNTGGDHWEDTPAHVPCLTVPSQSYVHSKLPSLILTAFSQSLSQQYSSLSATCSHRLQSLSPSPQSPLCLSPVPHTKRTLDKKGLACLFCRGRKIACGPPRLGSKDKTCK